MAIQEVLTIVAVVKRVAAVIVMDQLALAVASKVEAGLDWPKEMADAKTAVLVLEVGIRKVLAAMMALAPVSMEIVAAGWAEASPVAAETGVGQAEEVIMAPEREA